MEAGGGADKVRARYKHQAEESLGVLLVLDAGKDGGACLIRQCPHRNWYELLVHVDPFMPDRLLCVWLKDRLSAVGVSKNWLWAGHGFGQREP